MFFWKILPFFKVPAEHTFSSAFQQVAEMNKRHLLPGISLGGENAF